MDATRKNAVLGALVADAASLGLHWIYDVERLAQVAGEQPAFRAPELAHYRGVAAYFAHGHKQVGELTHYGEQLMVGLRSLAASEGAFDGADFEKQFVETFGPGGTWVGYIDFATRETLRRIDAAEQAAVTAAKSFDLGAHEGDRKLMEAKVLANARRWSGERLARAMAKAVRITHGENESLIATGQAMARAVEQARGGVHGADDLQLPAISRLPALLAFSPDATASDVDAFVRATNDNDAAVAWAAPVAELLRAVYGGQELATALRQVADGHERLTEALAFDGDVIAVAGHFGRACPLPQAAPLCWALLAQATGYVQLVEANIRAGGDSAGRAILLGAIAGAVWGVPAEWQARVPAATAAAQLLR